MRGTQHPVYFTAGVDFVGCQLTEVGAGKLRRKLKAALKKGVKTLAKASIGIPPGLSRRTMVSGEYDVGFAFEPDWREMVEGIDFVRGPGGDRLTEVGAGKIAKKIKAGLKKAGKAVGKVAQSVVKMAAKVVPPPYNVAFSAAAKIGDKAASAVQKRKAKQAVKGLAQLAKGGDKKAAATLATVKLAADAQKGKPAGALKLVAAAKAKKPAGRPAAAPARPPAAAARAARPAPSMRRAQAPSGTFEVISPSGRRFAVKA